MREYMIKTSAFRLGLSGLLSICLVVGLPLSALGAGTFVDDDGNPHEAAIEAIALAGITDGCNPPTNDRYCPGLLVTRGQMAKFLTRAFDLPPTAIDAFTDDEGSIYEAEINSVSAAGLTAGCAPAQFCPNAPVTREQMAAFLVRALSLPPAMSGNRFTDDDNSMFESEIDSLAEAGITTGCAELKFCPLDLVLRDQMASFLARSLALELGTSQCTTVIGFSQTREWYLGGQFEQVLIDAEWQLLQHSGAAIEFWADPAYEGWLSPIVSPCSAGAPDRLVLTISGESRPIDLWVTHILQAVATARAKYPSAQQIVLQPVVGGPGHTLCMFDGREVRASRNHPIIDDAIAIAVAGADASVMAGASPEVRSCDDFSDSVGHLVDTSEGPIGGTIAQFYLFFGIAS